MDVIPVLVEGSASMAVQLQALARSQARLQADSEDSAQTSLADLRDIRTKTRPTASSNLANRAELRIL
jgi:hypothetical protein